MAKPRVDVAVPSCKLSFGGQQPSSPQSVINALVAHGVEVDERDEQFSKRISRGWSQTIQLPQGCEVDQLRAALSPLGALLTPKNYDNLRPYQGKAQS